MFLKKINFSKWFIQSKHSGQKKNFFLVSSFLIFVSNRFAMLLIFYKQSSSGNSTASCLWLWVNFYLKGCLVLVVQAIFIISCIFLQLVHCNSPFYLTSFFYKQSIFDPRPKYCLSFSKKLPQKDRLAIV